MNLSQKQKRLLVLATLLVAFVILALLNTVEFKTPDVTTQAPYAPDPLPPESFYPTPEGDLSSEAGYLMKDRVPAYTKEGLTEDLATAHDYPYTDFFKAYFTALQNGDAKSLNSLYSEVYFRNHKPFTAFSKQYLYDVTVSYFDEATIEKADSEEDQKYIGRKLVYFEVTYSIYKNDGSFRQDIVDEMAITQIFTLLLDKNDANPKLNSISYWKNDQSNTEPSDLLPLLLPVIWIGIAIISLVIALIVKRKTLYGIPLSAFCAFLVSMYLSLIFQIVSFLSFFALFFSLVFYLNRRAAKIKAASNDPES